jgi:anti-anti-sigma factor
MALTVSVTVDEGIPGLVRVYPMGSVDSSTASVLEDELRPVLDDDAVSTIAVDLRKVSFLTSAGLRVIVAARKRMAAKQGSLLLANPQPQVAKVFEIIESLPGLNIFGSVEELDTYLANMQRKMLEEDGRA